MPRFLLLSLEQVFVLSFSQCQHKMCGNNSYPSLPYSHNNQLSLHIPYTLFPHETLLMSQFTLLVFCIYKGIGCYCEIIK